MKNFAWHLQQIFDFKFSFDQHLLREEFQCSLCTCCGFGELHLCITCMSIPLPGRDCAFSRLCVAACNYQRVKNLAPGNFFNGKQSSRSFLSAPAPASQMMTTYTHYYFFWYLLCQSGLNPAPWIKRTSDPKVAVAFPLHILLSRTEENYANMHQEIGIQQLMNFGG